MLRRMDDFAVQPLKHSPNIALVTETWPPEINGVAMTLSRFAQGLSARGWQVTLVRPRQSVGANDIHQHVLVPGLPIPGYAGLRFGLPVSNTLRRLWTKQRPDVVHIATEGPLGWAALKAAKKLQLPVTTSFHTNFHRYCRHYRLGSIRRSVERYLRQFHNQASCTMTPNEPLSQTLRQDGYRNVHTVGRGIDAELFHPRHRNDALRQQWGASVDDLVVIHVGRIAAEKNLQAVADAFERMSASLPNAKMVWVGDGPLLKSMKKRYPKHIFSGAKLDKELAEHYASADMFLFASMTETFGNVVLEAMSSGLAVVAYRYAAAETYIYHGKSGLLAAFGDNREFMHQAMTLCGDLQAIRSVGVAARKAIEDQPWDEVCMKFESLLCAAMKGEALCLTE
jgi:glycosyltransferase involved in cell wall biosynthesis